MSVTCPQGHVLSCQKRDYFYVWVCASGSNCVGDCKFPAIHPGQTTWRCSQDNRVIFGGVCNFDLCGDCAEQEQGKLTQKNSTPKGKDIKKGTDKGATKKVGTLVLRNIVEELENIEAIDAVMESEKETLCELHAKEITKNVEEQKTKKDNFLKSQKIALEKFVEEQKKEVSSVTDKQRMEMEEFERTSLNNKIRQKELQTNLQAHLNLSATPDSSSDIPECPVCLEDMKPPLKVFTCRNGHLICSTCRPRVSLCTNCREEYTGRATAVEQIIRKMLKME